MPALCRTVPRARPPGGAGRDLRTMRRAARRGTVVCMPTMRDLARDVAARMPARELPAPAAAPPPRPRELPCELQRYLCGGSRPMADVARPIAARMPR